MNLSVFHQGSYENGQLWYSYFDGKNWGPHTQVPNVGMSGSPSAVALPGGGISVFHQGAYENGQLWYSYYDGKNWGPHTQVPNVGMSGSPSAVALPGGGISVFHRGAYENDENGQLWYSYYDGKNWGPDTQVQVPNVVWGLPSAVAFPNGSISVFHWASVNGQLLYSYYDGKNWDGISHQLKAVLAAFSPSAVILPGGGISVFHQGAFWLNEALNADGQLWYSYYDGKNWGPDTQVPNVGMSGSPSAVVF